jgi:hypothetical protein
MTYVKSNLELIVVKMHICNKFMKERKNLNVRYVMPSSLLKLYLKIHSEAVHEGKKSFNCGLCDASFAQKITLKGHIAS